MGRLAYCLAVVGVTAAVASGATATTPPRPIQFGITGGNVVPYTVTIKPSGRVTVTRPGGATVHRKIATARLRKLAREIQNAHLAKKRTCSANNPDESTEYIRLAKQTYSLLGNCEPGFQRVWSDLAQVAGHLPK